MEAIDVMRHSAAHVMAHAVCNLFDNVKLDIGPSTEEGFYYDFDLEHRLSPEDFPRIEAEIEALIQADLPFERLETTCGEAARILADQPYKLERLADIPRARRSPFTAAARSWNLCRGPHVNRTSKSARSS